jgi:MFS family permease
MQNRLNEKRRHQYHHYMPARGVLPWFICGLASVFYCYEFFLRIAPSVVVKPLMHSYHVKSIEIGVLLAFYFYAYTPMQLLVGVLMDRYGPRRLLTFAVLLCAIGAYLFQATSLIWVADAGRFMIGFGSAFAFVGVLKLATIWLPPERFALVAGFTVMLGMLGAIGADTVLPKMVIAMGWRHAMLVGTGFGLVLAVLIWAIVRDSVSGGKGKMIRHRVRNFRHAIKGLLYIIQDWRIWVTGVVGALMFMPTTIFAGQWGVSFFETTRHLNTEQAGVLNSMIYWGWAVGGPIVG